MQISHYTELFLFFFFFLGKKGSKLFLSVSTCVVFDLQHCVIWKKWITEYTTWMQTVFDIPCTLSGWLHNVVYLISENFYMLFSLFFLFRVLLHTFMKKSLH